MKENAQNTAKKSPIGGRMAIALAAVGLLSIGGLVAMQKTSTAGEVVVYKSPTCGCCKEWVKHLQENGYKVEVHEQYDVTPIKRDLGVPNHLRSCHTATVDGYVLEGHVPADLISRMQTEKPAIKGLAVPGMPMGSPGMEGPRKDPYDVIAFEEKGKTTVYATR